MHQVHFIGAGPGDPQHLTLKGARALELSATVFAPTPYEVTFAERLKDKAVFVPFDFYFAELLSSIDQALQSGDVAFLVPGDLTFYSPFQCLVDALGAKANVIPGVGTANVAAALTKKTLDLPGICNRAILASPRTLGDSPDAPTLAQLAAPGVTLLIYMNNLPLAELCRQLRQGYGRSVPISLFHRLGLPGEEVVNGELDTIAALVGDRDFFNLNGPDRRPALTLVIVGETLTAQADGSWWDWRREHIWQHRTGGE